MDKDLDPAHSKKMISAAERFGIPVTVALIAGFPEETDDDLRETIDM